MKIESDANLRGQLKRLNQQQRDLIVAKKAEISVVDNLYDKKKNQAQIDGEIDLIDLSERNDAELSQSIEQKQKRLHAIKDDFNKQGLKLESERQNLINSHRDRISNVNVFYDDKYKEQFSDAKLKSENINLDTSNQINKLQDESSRVIRDQSIKANRLSQTISLNHDKNIVNQEREFSRQTKSVDNEYRQIAHRQKLDNEHKLHKQNMENVIERTERQKTHQRTLTDKEDHHKELLAQKDAAFKTKFETLEKNHKLIFERMQQRFNQEIDAKISSHSKTKEVHELKANDDFYKVEKLNPKIKETPDSYLISLEVAEHEKEDVRLTGNGRNISLALTRRFADISTDADGTSNSNKRSEVFNKQFQVGQIINQRDITQSYEEGTLTFKVAKG